MAKQSRRARSYKINDDIRCLYVAVLRDDHKIMEYDRFLNFLDRWSFVIITRSQNNAAGEVAVLTNEQY